MTASPKLRPFARGSLVAIIALMAGVLAVTAWTSWRAVKDASSTMLLGQANALQQTLRAQFAEFDELPSHEDLSRILEEEKPSGLRYLAVVAPDEAPVEVGEALSPLSRVLPLQRPEEPILVGNRVRLFFRARGLRFPAHSLRHRMGRPGKPLLVAVEFEPVQVLAVRKAAARTFAIGAISATTLLLVALGLLRWLLRREAEARAHERERRLASLGEMSAVLAHEIRNPLASLKGNAQLLAEAMAAGTDEKNQAKAQRVVAEAVRLETLTNDLIDYVRHGELRPMSIDPAALLRECVEALGAKASAVSIESGQAPATWTVDPNRLRQVLVNLLENAVQAGPPVTARVRASSDRLVFQVSDSGPGVPESERERIFEPFFTKRVQGTGLGLSIARRWVELHQGTLTVDSSLPHGATFTVSLPRR